MGRVKEYGEHLKLVLAEAEFEYEGKLSPGNKVGLLRKIRQMSQAEMAELLGVSRQTIGAYETRPNASPSPEALRRLSERLSVSLTWFYDGKINEPTLSPEIVGLESNSLGDAYTHKSPPVGTLDVLENINSTIEPDPNYSVVPTIESWPRFFTLFEIENVYILRVSGDGLGSRAPQGSFVVFALRNSEIPPDTLVLVDGAEGYKPRILGLTPQGRLSVYIPAFPTEDKAIPATSVRGGAIAIVRRHTSGPNIEYDDGAYLVFRKQADERLFGQ